MVMTCDDWGMVYEIVVPTLSYYRLVNIAMENDPFIDDFPSETSIRAWIFHGHVE